jgi:hypothetical protein
MQLFFNGIYRFIGLSVYRWLRDILLLIIRDWDFLNKNINRFQKNFEQQNPQPPYQLISPEE